MAIDIRKFLKGLRIKNDTDPTKELEIQAGGSTGTKTILVSSQSSNQTITFPDATDTLTGKNTADNLTHKTFDNTSTATGIRMASFTPDGTNTLTAPTATDTLVGQSTTDTLANKTLTTPTINGGTQSSPSITTPSITGNTTTTGSITSTASPVFSLQTAAPAINLTSKAIRVITGSGTGSGSSGIATLASGTSDTSSGGVNVLSGSGTGTNSSTGNVQIKSGDATGTGNSGNVTIAAGAISTGTRGTVSIDTPAISNPTLSGTVATPITASRALVTDSSQNLAASATTSTELGYVSGVTSAIQTQLNSKIAQSIITAKGDLIVGTGSGTETNLPIGSDGQVLTADSTQTTGTKWAVAPTAPTSSNEISNLGLSVSVSSNALTVAIKQSDGSTNPSSGSPVKIGMRSSTLTSGAYNQRSLTSSSSLTVASGATLGTANANTYNLYMYLIDNAGTLEPAISLCLFPENQLISTTALSGSSNSNAVMYSNSARTNVPFRVIAVLTSTQTTAGTWAAVPTTTAVGNYGQIVATENVSFYVYSASTTGTLSSSSLNTVKYAASVIKDTHNSYSTSTGKFTAPISSWYEFEAAYALTHTTASGFREIGLAYNGSTIISDWYDYISGAGDSMTTHLKGRYYMFAGDTMEVQSKTTLTTPAFTSSQSRNFFSGKRTGT